MPPINQPKPSLEIRINSLDDARAVINQSGKIYKKMQELKLETIEFLVADEIRKEVNELIRSIPAGFRKTFTSYVSARNNNVFYPLDHFKNRIIERRIVQPVQVPTLKTKSRGGRPKGSKNKKRVNTDAPEQKVE